MSPGPRRFEETVRGIRLVVEDGGRGPDVMWGHGLTSSMDREVLLGLVDWPAVRDDARVVRYDARGHGGSESTAEPESYHWRELALDQLALADALGIGTYVAGGASMGCATALHAAVLAPERIRALVLVIPPTAWETRAAQQAAYAASAALVEQGRIETLVRARRALPLPDPFVDVPAFRESFEEMVRTADPVRLARVMRGAAVADLPPPDAVASIAAPALVLAWSGDAGHPTSTAERLAELLPVADLAIASTPDELGTWTDRVRTFLARC